MYLIFDTKHTPVVE